MLENISYATAKNWKRLNVSADEKLTLRANKTNSKKKFLPTEYLTNKDNSNLILNISGLIEKNNFDVSSAMFSLCINFLNVNGILNKIYVKKFISDYAQIKVIDSLTKIFLPKDEFDILGVIYQSLMSEGKKNLIGSYYTPQKISADMTKNFSFEDNQNFLDPACGSGSYLLTCKTKNPKNLFGVDNDFIAVMIAKTNLLVKFKAFDFLPQIFLADYLAGFAEKYRTMKFDYIATNPPWGAVATKGFNSDKIFSGESFSCFYVNAFNQLKPNGIIKFLFPQSILNVKVHKDIRNFILSHGSLDRIKICDNPFRGVVTDYVEISASNSEKKSCVEFISEGIEKIVDTSAFYLTKNLIFNSLSSNDIKILEKVRALKSFTLEKSIWALGIVTGDNKNKLFDSQIKKSEPIYTGKEILPYILKPPKKFIIFDKNKLQQVAKTEIYRATEKLIYKFISKNLVFAYDDAGKLFLNSANVLIPNVPGMSIKTVMCFLNSSLYQYLYLKLFGEVKILQGNLSELPFPKISEEINKNLNSLAEKYIACQNPETLIKMQDTIYKIFSLSKEEQEYIEGVVNGKISF